MLLGGIEMGGTTCVAALASPTGEILERIEVATTTPEATIAPLIAFFTDRREVPERIGIGAFGPVDLDPASPRWGWITTTPKPGWADTELAPRVARETRAAVVFESDVSAAAYGEWVHAGADRAECVAYLTVGTGIGAGVIVHGRPWHGALGPEVGHLRLPRSPGDPHPGRCPSHGDCWEGLCAAPALADRCAGPLADSSDEDPLWGWAVDYLADGILAITLALTPHRLILGGGVGRRPGLRERVRDRLGERLAGYLASPRYTTALDTYLVAPALGEAAGVLGAIGLARDAAPIS